MSDQTIINIEELRRNKTDSLPYHLWSISLDCKMKRDSYWRYYHDLQKKSDVVSIPLLIFSTATGFFSVSQLNNNDQRIGILLTIVSIISAIIAALQKFFRFSERAENAKDIAKNYARLGRKIENTMVLVESDAVKMPQDEFTKFINTVQNDCDMLLQETNDVPDELLADRNEYKIQLENLNRIKMSLTQQTSEPSTRSINLTREMDTTGLNIDDMRMMNHMMSRDIVTTEMTEIKENEPKPNALKPNALKPNAVESDTALQMIEYLHTTIENEKDDTRMAILKNLLEHVHHTTSNNSNDI